MRLEGMTRRDLLKIASAGVAAAGVPSLALANCGSCASKARAMQISLQLYSVRGDCGKDIDNAMARVAKMGFAGVEFAGYYKYGKDPEALKKKLDDLGLKAAGTHIGANSFAKDRIQATIDFHKTIGCKYLIIPGDGRFCKPDGNKELADFLNEAAVTLKAQGMYCGYHNHSKEFSKHDGKSYWDWFAERTSEDVVLQQDVGWTSNAGCDPAEYVRKYPGRTKITHFKTHVARGDAGKKAFIGQDSQDWKSIIKACHEAGGTEWITIEQERYPDGKSPMECSEISLKGLKAILSEMKL